MKALIIDDERLARKELTNLLQEYHEVEIVGQAVNAEDAEEKIKELEPDLLFLDIQMPGKTGFELLQSLDAVPEVIFTTAYDEHALKAFDFNALDYLLKPIEPNRLQECIDKLLKRTQNADPEEGGKLQPQHRVFVKDGNKCWFVKLEDIRLLESDGNYIRVYFDKFKPMINKSLNVVEEKLDKRFFFRASRKHIINLNWVENIESWFNGGLMVVLRGGEKVEVSRRQTTHFKEVLGL